MQARFTCALVLGVSLFAVAQSSSADVTVKYQMDSPEGSAVETIRFHDPEHVRLEMRDVAHGRVAVMIRRGGKVYAVAPNGEVIEMTGGMASALGGLFGGTRHSGPASGARFEDTGRTERVAGYTGRVYRYTGRGGQHEVVLTQDRELAAVLQAWTDMNKLMTHQSGSSQDLTAIRENGPGRHTGFLRFDHSMRLLYVDHGPVGRAAFELPGRPMETRGYAASRTSSGSLLEQDSRDIANHTANTAHQSVKQGIQGGIDQQIQKSVNGLIQGLFNH